MSAQPLLRATLHYDNLTEDLPFRSEEIAVVTLNRPSPDAPEAINPEVNSAVDLQLNRVTVVNAFVEATALADQGQFEMAQQCLKNAEESVHGSSSSHMAGDLFTSMR